MKTTIDMAREAGFNLNFRITGSNEALDRLVEYVRADERDECAKVCENDAWRCKKIAIETQNKKANAAALEAYLCAEAIRARGNT
jgi:hypothetical protein